MLERINLILKSRNLNAAQFADEIGVQRSSVSHILTGRNNASLDFLLKVLQRYPEIDTDWLLRGQGVMMRGGAVRTGNRIEAKESEPVPTPPTTPLKEITGDLFKQPIDSKQDIKKEFKMPEDSGAIGTRQTVPEKNQEEEQKKPGQEVATTNSARHVEKIVIFYSDKTFVDYKPEN